MAALPDDPIRRLAARGEAQPSVLTLAAWGFVAVLAVLAGFASWQYAPRVETAGRLDGAETTGSIAALSGHAAPSTRDAVLRGQTDLQPVLRELDGLRQEILDLRTVLARSDRKADLLSQRVTLIEDQGAILAAGLASLAQRAQAEPPPPAPAPAAPAAEARPEPAPPALAVRPALEPERSAAAPAEPKPAAVARPAAEARPAPAEAKPAASAKPVPPGAIGPGQPARVSPTPTVAIGGGPGAAQPRLSENNAAQPRLSENNAAQPRPSENNAAQPRPSENNAASPRPSEAAAQPRTPETTGALPAPARARTEYGVDLGGYRTLAQLKKGWLDFNGRQPQLARGIAPLAQLRESGDTLEARLIGGPFASPAEALRYCIQAKAAGIACAPAPYTGQPAR